MAIREAPQMSAFMWKQSREDGFISFVILTGYVYDIIPVSNDVKMLKPEEESLCKEFEMVDLG